MKDKALELQVTIMDDDWFSLKDRVLGIVNFCYIYIYINIIYLYLYLYLYLFIYIYIYIIQIKLTKIDHSTTYMYKRQSSGACQFFAEWKVA